ncbi:hypothetical protein DRH14_03805 [Candidatus Shapirobacteria bacterium]|nr:MAG: hypothetical protein DRH14_03805 [Candidatus Shapirobacteria bacterium]
MVNAQVKMNFRIPKVSVQEDLLHIAQKIFIPYMQRGINRNSDIEGGSFPALAPSTIRRKGHSDPLIETGKLRSAFRFKKKGKLEVLIDIKSNRAKIGKYLQIDGTKSGKHFNFFGISRKMEDQAIMYMKKRIEKAIKNAK